MARSWPIQVVVLVIFLATTFDCARTIPEKTLLDKLDNVVSSAVHDFRTVGSDVKTLSENVDLISELATEQLQSCFRAIKLLEHRRKPVATTSLPNVMTPLPNVTTPLQNVTKLPTMNTTRTEACGDGWTRYGASFFSFCTCTQPCSVNNARDMCREKQAELAKVASREQENFIMRSRNRSLYTILGLNDRDEDRLWRWPDGSRLNDSYTNWRRGRPNGARGFNCLVVDARGPYWYDTPCDNVFSAYSAGFVCERKRL